MNNINGIGAPPLPPMPKMPPLPPEVEAKKEPKKQSGILGSGLDLDYNPPMPPVGGMTPQLIAPDNAYVSAGFSFSVIPSAGDADLISKIPSKLSGKLERSESSYNIYPSSIFSAGVPNLFKVFGSYHSYSIENGSSNGKYSGLSIGASARLDGFMAGYVWEKRGLKYNLKEWDPRTARTTTNDKGTVESHTDNIVGKYLFNDFVAIGGIVPLKGDPTLTIEAFRVPSIPGNFLSAGVAVNRRSTGIDLTFYDGLFSLNAVLTDKSGIQVGGILSIGAGLFKTK